MNEYDIDKAYVSPYDKLIAKFDNEHALSASQLKEILIYKRISALRDGVKDDVKDTALWEGF